MMKAFGTPGPPPGPQEATAVLEQVRGLLTRIYLIFRSHFCRVICSVKIANGNIVVRNETNIVRLWRQMEAIVSYKASNILARARLV